MQKGDNGLLRLIRLKELREDKRWSIADVADRLNIAKSTYAGYEYGRRDIPTELLVEIARLYNVTSDYILALTDDKNIITDLKWQDVDEAVSEIDPEMAEALKAVGLEMIMKTKSLIDQGISHEQLLQLLEAVKQIKHDE